MGRPFIKSGGFSVDNFIWLMDSSLDSRLPGEPLRRGNKSLADRVLQMLMVDPRDLSIDGDLSPLGPRVSRKEAYVRSLLPDKPVNPGHPHKDYVRDQKDYEVIFKEILPQWEPHWYRTMIFPKFCVPESTFYDWKQQWEADHFWRPWHTEVHGVRLRAFDDDEEAQIAEVIRTEYIAAGRLFTEATFRELVMQAWEAFGRAEGEFVCSKHFISNFKHRNRFSSRRFHARRRNPAESQAQIAAWLATIRDLLTANEASRDMVVNCDETAWRLLPSGLLTWAPLAQMA
jgi:hypothetical protein